MQWQNVLYYLIWAGVFFAIMRFGCGAHIMGHGHHHRRPHSDDEQSTENHKASL